MPYVCPLCKQGHSSTGIQPVLLTSSKTEPEEAKLMERERDGERQRETEGE